MKFISQLNLACKMSEQTRKNVACMLSAATLLTTDETTRADKKCSREEQNWQKCLRKYNSDPEEDDKCEQFRAKVSTTFFLLDIMYWGGAGTADMMLLFLNDCLFIMKVLACRSHILCPEAEKIFLKCHGSIMGTGRFEGRNHCTKEIEGMAKCFGNHRFHLNKDDRH